MPVVIPDFDVEGIDLIKGAEAYKDKISNYDLFLGGVEVGFEQTLIGASIEGAKVQRAARKAEQELYGESFVPYQEQLAEAQGYLPLTDAQKAIFIDQEEWKTSPYYREGLEWQEGLTEPRAKIYAEVYDKRKARAELYDKNADTFGKKALFFGGNLIGNIPDPVNFTVFGGAARARTAGTAAYRGMADNVLSTLAADAAVFPILRQLGDDVGAADLATDLIFGAALGAGFGASGQKIGSFLEKQGIIRPKDHFVYPPRPIDDIKAEINSQVETAAITARLTPDKRAVVDVGEPVESVESVAEFAENAPKENWVDDGVSVNLVVDDAEVSGDVLDTFATVVDDMDIEQHSVADEKEFYRSFDAGDIEKNAKLKAEGKARKEARAMAKETVESDPLYARIKDLKKTAGIALDSLKGTYDASTIATLRKRHPNIVAKKTAKAGEGQAINFDELAEELGLDPEDLMEKLLHGETVKERTRNLEDEFFEGIKTNYDAEIELAITDAIGKAFFKSQRHFAPFSPTDVKYGRIKEIIDGKVPSNATEPEQKLAEFFAGQNLTKEQRNNMKQYMRRSIIAQRVGTANKVSDTLRPNGNLFDSEYPKLLDVTVGGYFNAISKKGTKPLSKKAVREVTNLDQAKTATKVMQKAVDDIANGELPDVQGVIDANPHTMPKGIEYDEDLDFSTATDVVSDEYNADLAAAESEYFEFNESDGQGMQNEFGIKEEEKVYVETETVNEEGQTVRSVEDISEQVNADTAAYMDKYEKAADEAALCLYGG